MELEFTERRTYDVHNTEKISIRLTNVGLAQARPNYWDNPGIAGGTLVFWDTLPQGCWGQGSPRIIPGLPMLLGTEKWR